MSCILYLRSETFQTTHVKRIHNLFIFCVFIVNLCQLFGREEPSDSFIEFNERVGSNEKRTTKGTFRLRMSEDFSLLPVLILVDYTAAIKIFRLAVCTI